LSGILDAVEGVFDALSNLASVSLKAFIAILIGIPIGAITVALVGASFTIVETASQGNPAAEVAVGTARTAYDVGDTLQDLVEYAKIFAPVAGAAIGAGAAIIYLVNKIRDSF
jgi:hypothetical protein